MDGEEKKAEAVAPVAGERGTDRSDSWTGLFVGFVLFAFCMLVLGIGLEAFGNFVDIPSFAIILGTVLGGWSIAYGGCRPFRLLLLAITGRAADVKEAQSIVAFCSCGIWLSLLSGAIGVIIGLINMLAMGCFSEKTEVLTSGIAVALITFFWSWILAVLLVALRYRAKETGRALELAAVNLK